MLQFIGKPHLRSLKLLVEGKFLISNQPTTGVIYFKNSTCPVSLLIKTYCVKQYTNTFSRIAFFEVSVFAESKRVRKSTRHSQTVPLHYRFQIGKISVPYFRDWGGCHLDKCIVINHLEKNSAFGRWLAALTPSQSGFRGEAKGNVEEL